MSRDTVLEVPVNRAEADKFSYLIKVMDALDRADARAEEDINFFRSTEGVKAEREFDWSQVQRFCAPQLLITFLRGAERWEEDRRFRKYPHSVIVARTAFVVKLDEAFELTLEETTTDNGEKSIGDMLRDLRSEVQQLEGVAAVDADRLITRLSKVLKIKL